MISAPAMLMVAGGGRGFGKTALVCRLIEKFSRERAVVGVKITTIDSFNGRHHREAVNLERDSSPRACYCIREEVNVGDDTDTSRMLASGAQKAIWLGAPERHLIDGLRALLTALGDGSVSICESGRARNVIEPGAFLMVDNCRTAAWKLTAEQSGRYADRVVSSDGVEFDIDLDDIQLLENRWAVRMRATAIILAGGDSIRMGRDKTMLPVQGKPMIQHVYEQLRPYFSRILISSNNPHVHGFLGARIVHDEEAGRGPLMGIVSSLNASADEVNFVVACDLPDVDIDLVRAMVRTVGDWDVVVPYLGPEREQPLFAIYRKSALPILQRTLSSGNNRVMDALAQCRVKRVACTAGNIQNLNTVSEYWQHAREKTHGHL